MSEFNTILAAACDIKGFNYMQSRVVDFYSSNYPPGIKNDLVNKFKQYIGETQRIARAKMAAVVADGGIERVRATPYGMIVGVQPSVSLNQDDEGRFDKEWINAVQTSVKALIDVIEISTYKGEGEISMLTNSFLEEWGGVLGVDFADEYSDGVAAHKEHQFEVVGAISINLGFGRPHTNGSDNDDLPEGAIGFSGHVVDLVMKLCGLAGRPNGDGGLCYPDLLIDKTCAQILMHVANGKASQYVQDWKIVPVNNFCANHGDYRLDRAYGLIPTKTWER